MVVTAKLYAEHPDLPLTPTIRSDLDVDVGVFTDAGTDPENDVYIFWVEAPDYDEVKRAFDDDHTVASHTLLVEDEDRATFRIEYSEDVTLMTPPIVDVGGVTLDSRSYSNGWMVHTRLGDHDALFALNEYASDHGIHLDLLELHQDEAGHDRNEFGLTEPQREALIAAYLQGYYDVPRQTTLGELASTLDISLTGASGRLRRGSAGLIEELLVDDPE